MNRTLFLSLGLALGLLSGRLAWADLADTIARVKPSVVIVGSYKATNSPRFALRGSGFVIATGSGGSAGGSTLVVSNAHVLPQPAEQDTQAALVVQVRTPDQPDWQMRAASVLEVDRLHDLALLRIDGFGLPGLVVQDSNQVREGQAVAFMGFPIGGALGFSPVTHRGTVSSIAAAALPSATAQQLNPQAIRQLRDGAAGFDIFQLDGTAYPGNSGGPLFDPDSGGLWGVVNMVLLKNVRESALSSPSGISYAIPSRHVLQLLQRHQSRPDATARP